MSQFISTVKLAQTTFTFSVNVVQRIWGNALWFSRHCLPDNKSRVFHEKQLRSLHSFPKNFLKEASWACTNALFEMQLYTNELINHKIMKRSLIGMRCGNKKVLVYAFHPWQFRRRKVFTLLFTQTQKNYALDFVISMEIIYWRLKRRHLGCQKNFWSVNNSKRKMFEVNKVFFSEVQTKIVTDTSFLRNIFLKWMKIRKTLFSLSVMFAKTFVK